MGGKTPWRPVRQPSMRGCSTQAAIDQRIDARWITQSGLWIAGIGCSRTARRRRRARRNERVAVTRVAHNAFEAVCEARPRCACNRIPPITNYPASAVCIVCVAVHRRALSRTIVLVGVRKSTHHTQAVSQRAAGHLTRQATQAAHAAWRTESRPLIGCSIGEGWRRHGGWASRSKTWYVALAGPGGRCEPLENVMHSSRCSRATPPPTTVPQEASRLVFISVKDAKPRRWGPCDDGVARTHLYSTMARSHLCHGC